MGLQIIKLQCIRIVFLTFYSTVKITTREKQNAMKINFINPNLLLIPAKNFFEDSILFPKETKYFSEDSIFFAEETKYFSEGSKLFPEETKYFSEDSILFAEETKYFPEDSILFAGETKYFSEDSKLFPEEPIFFIRQFVFEIKPCLNNIYARTPVVKGRTKFSYLLNLNLKKHESL